jgi:hypothetical protein
METEENLSDYKIENISLQFFYDLDLKLKIVCGNIGAYHLTYVKLCRIFKKYL